MWLIPSQIRRLCHGKRRHKYSDPCQRRIESNCACGRVCQNGKGKKSNTVTNASVVIYATIETKIKNRVRFTMKLKLKGDKKCLHNVGTLNTSLTKKIGHTNVWTEYGKKHEESISKPVEASRKRYISAFQLCHNWNQITWLLLKSCDL